MTDKKICDCNQGRMPCSCIAAEPGTQETLAAVCAIPAAAAFKSNLTSYSANVFFPGCLGPISREVVLLEDAEKLEAENYALEDQVRGLQELMENQRSAVDEAVMEIDGKLYTASLAKWPELPALNDDLLAILGRPNFTCNSLAAVLRLRGQEIRRKSEHEQAAVIHWLLGLYLKHGEKWKEVAGHEIDEVKRQHEGRTNDE